MTAASRISPRPINIVPSWDLNIVLKGLTLPPFEPLSSITMDKLAWKTTFLVAITTARRVGELQALSINEPYMKILQDRLILRLDPSFLPKVVSDFHKSQEIILPSFYQEPKNEEEEHFHTLDVRRMVLYYLHASEKIRKDQNLFIHLLGQNKGKKTSRSTIANWIKRAILEAYQIQGLPPPGKLTAHSTRATAVSWAEKASASIEQYAERPRGPRSIRSPNITGIDLMSKEDLAFGEKERGNILQVCCRGGLLETELTQQQWHSFLWYIYGARMNDKPENWDVWYESKFDDCDKEACLSFSKEILCSRTTVDHNYYAICQNLLSRHATWRGTSGGLLHDPPAEVSKDGLLGTLLDECANPKKRYGRFKAAKELREYLAQLSNNV
ncbi:unnamed protein product [Ranitomeya imitator]|uniref:FAM69 protein-kinase domain-containing protein n=1 Tax=Ranitomeya imitator TaxID=111125 RepID=A0ABN9LVX5_9NEOB|nr:unnamed protein product [Ranitomeya imitator]